VCHSVQICTVRHKKQGYFVQNSSQGSEATCLRFGGIGNDN